jgi:hypothetical protein
MGHAHAQQEAAAGLLAEGVLGSQGDAGLAVVDVGDAGGDVQPGGIGQQPGRVGHGVAAGGLRDPEGAVAERFDPLRRVRGGLRVHGLREVPDAELAGIHFVFLSFGIVSSRPGPVVPDPDGEFLRVPVRSPDSASGFSAR